MVTKALKEAAIKPSKHHLRLLEQLEQLFDAALAIMQAYIPLENLLKVTENHYPADLKDYRNPNEFPRLAAILGTTSDAIVETLRKWSDSGLHEVCEGEPSYKALMEDEDHIVQVVLLIQNHANMWCGCQKND